MNLLNVLVVDDSIANRILIKDMLKDKADCVEAEDGLSGWQVYSNALPVKPFDLILLDIAMPRMDGIALLSLIRENEIQKNLPRVPILVISAHTEKIEEARSMGFDDYLLKPITFAQLNEKISNVLKIRISD